MHPFSEDSDDEFQVFSINESIEEFNLKKMLLKFTNVQNSCWILKFVIVTKSMGISQPSLLEPRFNLHNLDSMLKKENIELSDKAKEFKQLFENFQKSAPPTMQILGNGGLTNLPPSLDLKQLQGSNLPKSEANCDFCQTKIKELETRIFTKLEDMEKKQNEKLDLIINLLSNSSKQ